MSLRPRREAPHGTITRYTRGRCRCGDCRQAQARYMARYRRLKAYGQWEGLVDAEPARRHVRALMAAPEPYESIAARAGVGVRTVCGLLYSGAGRAATKRMQAATSAALLALTPNPTSPFVDSTGTRRRAQALLSLGWSYTEQAKVAGVKPRTYMYAVSRPRIMHRTAAMVARVYDQLWHTPAPDSPLANRTRRQASYPPPMAWDDSTIDDPAAEPEGQQPVTPAKNSRLARIAACDVDEVAVARVVEYGRPADTDRDLWARMTGAERRAVVYRLVELRWSQSRIGEHLRVSGATLAKYMPETLRRRPVGEEAA